MTLTSLQNTLALSMDDVYYQVTGMGVVFCCLVFLSLILTVSGKVAVAMDEAAKAKAAAAKAVADAAAAKKAASTAAPAAAATPTVAEPTPAEIAALAAGIYNTARSSITPEVVAAIAAAVRVTLGDQTRVLDIKPTDSSYAQSGRTAIMNSHYFPKKG